MLANVDRVTQLDEEAEQLVSGFVDIYLELEPSERVEFKQAIEKLEPQGVIKMNAILTSWEREGEATRGEHLHSLLF